MMPRHGTAEAMAMGLQGALPGVPRWGLGVDPLPPPEQQGENLMAFVQGWKGRVPVAKPGATPEEQKRVAELAALAKQGQQTATGVQQLSQRLGWSSPAAPLTPVPVAASKPLPPWVVPAVAAGVVALLYTLGKKD